MKTPTTIQKNIWVSIDEVCVTVVVTAKRTKIFNERYLSKAGRAYVMRQVGFLKPQAIVLSKQQRQVKRLPKNQSRSTLLAVKQSVNNAINSTSRNKKLSIRVKTHLLNMHNKMKAGFTY